MVIISDAFIEGVESFYRNDDVNPYDERDAQYNEWEHGFFTGKSQIMKIIDLDERKDKILLFCADPLSRASIDYVREQCYPLINDQAEYIKYLVEKIKILEK